MGNGFYCKGKGVRKAILSGHKSALAQMKQSLYSGSPRLEAGWQVLVTLANPTQSNPLLEEFDHARQS
jgi:hypothetical protein